MAHKSISAHKVALNLIPTETKSLLINLMIHHSEGLVAQSEQDHYLKLGTVSQLHVPKDMFLGYVINCE